MIPPGEGPTRIPTIALVILLSGLVCLACPVAAQQAITGAPWVRHTIDDSSRGADGVRLADVNGDGRPDIATPWEEGGVVRAYIHPGPEGVTKPWPSVTVGTVGDPEDAVFVDLDEDGGMDVVSCCEGDTKRMWVHWGPKDRGAFLDGAAWETEALAAGQGALNWMFCLPMQVDGQRGVDLVAGAKGEGAAVGWFESPEEPRDLASWTWHPLCAVGWIMTLAAVDMDRDGDLDVVVSNRREPGRGCFWLERPGPALVRGPWPRHDLGAGDKEVMFLTLADLNEDKVIDVLAATCGRELVYLPGGTRQSQVIQLPDGAGTGKSVAVGDLDLDGRGDVVLSCEHAEGKSGVLWLSRAGHGAWRAHDISGLAGAKFDLVQLHDVDEDGDLDVLTCEEREGLGVIWYENPARGAPHAQGFRRTRTGPSAMATWASDGSSRPPAGGRGGGPS